MEAVKRALSRRDAFTALAAASPLALVAPAVAQTNDAELAAAEQRLQAAVESLRRFPLEPGAEPVTVFKA
jgi:hypothetical protein